VSKRTISGVFRQIGLAAIVAGLLLSMLGDVREFVVENDGISYYSRFPYMLLIPVAVACLAGLLIWWGSRLSGRRRRAMRRWGWAAVNIAVTCCGAWFVYVSFRLRCPFTDKASVEAYAESVLPQVRHRLAILAVVLLVGAGISWWRWLRALGCESA
jgi:hypothetical protein